MKKCKRLFENKLSPEKADSSKIRSKAKPEKKCNVFNTILSPFSCKKYSNTQEVDSTDNIMDILEINGTRWHSIKLLSEKDIIELIEQKRYFKADQHLIKLEYERYTNGTTEKDEDSINKEKQEIESLYELLSAAIFTVVKESMNISKEDPDLLKMAVQVKIQEEKADQIYLEEKEKSGSIPEVRPRGWEAKWLSILQQSVNERIGELPSASDDDNTNEWLSQCLVQLRSQLEEDLDIIVNCIKPCYPQEYNICEKYAEYYHNKLSSHIALIAESGLTGKDVYPFLYWIYNCYPKTMIAAMQSEDISQQLLNILLPERMISNLKNEYFSAIQSNAKMHMDNSLHMEEESWGSEKEPLALNNCYHSELPIDIIQIIEGAFQTSRTLTCELGDLTLDILLEQTNWFLESFQRSAENFEKNHLSHPYFICIIISITNSCESIRNYLERNEKITNAVMKQNALSILNEMEKRRKDVLLKTLFCKLKPLCKKLVTEKWLMCPEPVDKIFEITEEHLTKLKKLKAPQYQDLLREIHKQLITEYILRIMKKRLSCKTENQQKQVANQIENEADQLQKLFSFYGSEATFLETALPKVAEIIRLKDVNAIIMEVAALFHDFPDVRKQHIGAILHIKVNMKKSDEKKILNILNTPMNDTVSSMDRKLFSNSTILKAV